MYVSDGCCSAAWLVALSALWFPNETESFACVCEAQSGQLVPQKAYLVGQLWLPVLSVFATQSYGLPSSAVSKSLYRQKFSVQQG